MLLGVAFERAYAPTATLEDGSVTCCVVRPHAIHAGHAGARLVRFGFGLDEGGFGVAVLSPRRAPRWLTRIDVASRRISS